MHEFQEKPADPAKMCVGYQEFLMVMSIDTPESSLDNQIRGFPAGQPPEHCGKISFDLFLFFPIEEKVNSSQ
jgi:hypothetical protein